VSDQGISTNTLVGGLIVACVSVLAAFGLARTAKQSDSDRDQALGLARHDGRLTNIEDAVHRLESLQRATSEAMQAIVLQVAGLQQTIQTRPVFDARAALLIEDIRRLTEDIKRNQTLDHTLITALHERVRTLELLTKPLPGETERPTA
jgi:hypothetical protein